MSSSTVDAPGPASTESSLPPTDRAHRDGSDLAPVRARGVQLFGEMRGSGYRSAPALVRREDGQTITLSPLLYGTLDALAEGHSWDSFAQEVSLSTDRRLTADDVQYLVTEKLTPLGLVVAADGAEPVTRRNNPLLALRLKVVITDERVTRRLTAPFAALFAPVVAIPVLLAFAAISWWVLVEKGLASALHQAVFQPGMVLALWAMIVLSAAFHEFGHAAACRYGGATPGVMGAGLYIVWPAFYTEVTDSYRLGRGGPAARRPRRPLLQRDLHRPVVVPCGGGLRWDALLLLVVAQHLQMVRQLAPFIRADGYHIVADLIGVPDLFSHIKPTLAGVLPRRWRPAGQPPLKRWARAVVVLWVGHRRAAARRHDGGGRPAAPAAGGHRLGRYRLPLGQRRRLLVRRRPRRLRRAFAGRVSWWRCRCSRSCTCSAGWSGAPCAACGSPPQARGSGGAAPWCWAPASSRRLVWAWWPVGAVPTDRSHRTRARSPTSPTSPRSPSATSPGERRTRSRPGLRHSCRPRRPASPPPPQRP